jgi:hypothetical protein
MDPKHQASMLGMIGGVLKDHGYAPAERGARELLFDHSREEIVAIAHLGVEFVEAKKLSAQVVQIVLEQLK